MDTPLPCLSSNLWLLHRFLPSAESVPHNTQYPVETAPITVPEMPLLSALPHCPLASLLSGTLPALAYGYRAFLPHSVSTSLLQGADPWYADQTAPGTLQISHIPFHLGEVRNLLPSSFCRLPTARSSETGYGYETERSAFSVPGLLLPPAYSGLFDWISPVAAILIFLPLIFARSHPVSQADSWAQPAFWQSTLLPMYGILLPESDVPDLFH